MKRVLIVMLAITTLFLTGCFKKEEEKTQTPVDETQVEKQLTDADVLEDLKQKIKVVENRKEYNDEEGNLLYYIQKDYLTTDENDEALKKIVANYPQKEITPVEGEVQKMYPNDVYYDTTTYSLFDVHHGILTIATENGWWWGSPHPWPSSSFDNYVISTGEKYEFPADIQDDIYQKAVDEFMKIAKENDYDGLESHYFDDAGNMISYLKYEEDHWNLTDEAVLRALVEREIRNGSFHFGDNRIVFNFDASATLSDWASRMLYSIIEIPNEWNI